jgi:hypothetical protein
LSARDRELALEGEEPQVSTNQGPMSQGELSRMNLIPKSMKSEVSVDSKPPRISEP